MKKHYTAQELIDSGFVFHPMTFDFIKTTNDKNELIALGLFFDKHCKSSEAHMKTLNFKIFKRLFDNEYYKQTIREQCFAGVCLSECRKKIQSLKKFSKSIKNQ
jgi:hypothetical protein